MRLWDTGEWVHTCDLKPRRLTVRRRRIALIAALLIGAACIPFYFWWSEGSMVALFISAGLMIFILSGIPTLASPPVLEIAENGIHLTRFWGQELRVEWRELPFFNWEPTVMEFPEVDYSMRVGGGRIGWHHRPTEEEIPRWSASHVLGPPVRCWLPRGLGGLPAEKLYVLLRRYQKAYGSHRLTDSPAPAPRPRRRKKRSKQR